MRILVVGGYGLIGLAIVKALLARGVEVRGAGRSPDHGARLDPRAQWVALDLARPDTRFVAALDGDVPVDDAEVLLDVSNPVDPDRSLAIIDLQDESFATDVKQEFEETWENATTLE